MLHYYFQGIVENMLKKVALNLKDNGITIFYDMFVEADLWGKDLGIHFNYEYRKAAKCCVAFIYKSYKEKVCTNHEIKTQMIMNLKSFKIKKMNKKTLLFLFLLTSITVFSQNVYQQNLYSLNIEIKAFEKKLKKEKLTIGLLYQKLDLTKRLNHLGEEAMEESLNQNLDRELAELILYSTKLANSKLDFLESYRAYDNDFYLTKYNEMNNIYLSIYLKIKAK